MKRYTFFIVFLLAYSPTHCMAGTTNLPAQHSVASNSNLPPANAQQKDNTQEKAPTLIPHRAYYEISATEKVNGIADVKGNATIEIRPVPGGYIRNVNITIYLHSEDTTEVQTITRSFATFESGDGQDYSFRMRTRNELGEEVSLRGEGLAPPQLLGVLKCVLEPETDSSNSLEDLGVIDPSDIGSAQEEAETTQTRTDLPPNTIFPTQLLMRTMDAINKNQNSLSVSLFDPYWGNVYDVHVSINNSRHRTAFNLQEDLPTEASKHLNGQYVGIVTYAFYPMGVKESTGAEEPLHQVFMSLLPCGIMTECKLEDPTVGNQIVMTLKKVQWFQTSTNEAS